MPTSTRAVPTAGGGAMRLRQLVGALDRSARLLLSERSEDRRFAKGTRSVTVQSIWRFFSCVEEGRTSTGTGLRAMTSEASQPGPCRDDDRLNARRLTGSAADRRRCGRGAQADR